MAAQNLKPAKTTATGQPSAPQGAASASMVNHPSHYNHGSIETIDFIEDQKFDFHIGTAIRYLCRAGYKWNEKEDLEKAIWYIQRKIDLLERRDTQ